jgi:hypothetical protein
MYSAPEPDTTISMGVSDTPMLEIGLASVKYTFSTATWFVGDAKREFHWLSYVFIITA